MKSNISWKNEGKSKKKNPDLIVLILFLYFILILLVKQSHVVKYIFKIFEITISKDLNFINRSLKKGY